MFSDNIPLEAGEEQEDAAALLSAEQPAPMRDETEIRVSDMTISEMMLKAKNESVLAATAAPPPPSTEDHVKRRVWSFLPKHKQRLEIVSRILTFTVFYSILQFIYTIIRISVGGITSLDQNAMAGPSTASLQAFGATSSKNLKNGHVFLLLTPMALYGGIFDAIVGLVVQVYLGSFVFEERWGPLKLSAIYFGSGIISMLGSMLWSPDLVSVGAIAALFGLFGARISDIICIFGEPVIEADPRRWKLRVRDVVQVVLPAIVLILMSNAVFISSPIDVVAEVTALVAGLLLGFAIFAFDSRHLKKRIMLSGLSIAGLLTGVLILFIRFYS